MVIIRLIPESKSCGKTFWGQFSLTVFSHLAVTSGRLLDQFAFTEWQLLHNKFPILGRTCFVLDGGPALPLLFRHYL
jgi:hypothetical protein